MKLVHALTPNKKINSNLLENLNIHYGTIKLLGRNIGKAFSSIIVAMFSYISLP